MRRQKRKDKSKKRSQDQERKMPKRRGVKISKSKITTFLVILCVAAVVIFDCTQRSGRNETTLVPEVRTKGFPDAEIKITEFVDFQCPECARGSQLLRRYFEKESSRIYLAVRYYPLQRLHSLTSAVHAECAARQDKFWSFHDILFDRQSDWAKLPDASQALRKMARDAGVDLEELDQCLQSGQARAVVLSEKDLGETLFVKATPSYFINGEMVVGYPSFEKKMKKLLGYTP